MHRLVPLFAVAVLAFPIAVAAQEPVDTTGRDTTASPSFPSST